jgi:hypothetical protein
VKPLISTLTGFAKQCCHFHSVLRGHLIAVQVPLAGRRNFSDVESSVAVLYIQYCASGPPSTGLLFWECPPLSAFGTWFSTRVFKFLTPPIPANFQKEPPKPYQIQVQFQVFRLNAHKFCAQIAWIKGGPFNSHEGCLCSKIGSRLLFIMNSLDTLMPQLFFKTFPILLWKFKTYGQLNCQMSNLGNKVEWPQIETCNMALEMPPQMLQLCPWNFNSKFIFENYELAKLQSHNLEKLRIFWDL